MLCSEACSKYCAPESRVHEKACVQLPRLGLRSSYLRELADQLTGSVRMGLILLVAYTAKIPKAIARVPSRRHSLFNSVSLQAL